MARWEPWPVIDGAYKDDARPWSAQDTCNWLPTPAEQAGTRSPIMLRTPPGLIAHCDLGTGAPVRGQHDVEGLHLVVSGTTLFRVTPAGVATSIGTIPGVGRVSMDHTPHGSGFQVAIANGQSGYVYDTAANTLTQITDPGFPGAVIFQFIDGYLAFLEPFGGFWGHSELNDALSYNTLDRYTAESAPDGIVSLIVSHREVFVLGTRTGEFFRNTGVATGTFQRADGTEMERGICSPYAIARSDNTVKWVGDDGATYRLEGHQPVRISTGPLEQAFAQSNLNNAFAFNWEDKGHNVFYATLPDGHTWGHDAWTQRWHRRASYGLDRWRLATLVKTGGQWIGGDYTNGKLYRLSWAEDAVHENGQPLVSERTFPVAHDFGNDLIVNGVRLLFDTGKRGPEPTSVTTTTELLTANTLSNVALKFVYPYADGAAETVDVQPASVGRGGTWSPEGAHYVGPHDAFPYFTLYKRTGGVLIKQASLGIVSNKDIGWSAAWNPAGTRLAVGMRGNQTTFPFIVVLSRSGDTYTEVAFKNDTAAGSLKRAQSLSYSRDGALLAAAVNESPGLALYTVSGDTYTKVGSPGTIPTGSGSFVAFSPASDHLAYSHTGIAANSPLTVYSVSGSSITAVFQNTTDGAAQGMAWSRDGAYLAAIVSNGLGQPTLRVYSRSGNVFTLVASQSYPSGGSVHPAFTDTHLMVGVENLNAVKAYTIGSFAADTAADIALPGTSNGLAQFGLASGQATSTSTILPPDDRMVEMSISRDGGYNFGPWKQRFFGSVGAFIKRMEWLQLGKANEWIVKVRVSSPIKRDFLDASWLPEAIDR